MALDWADNTDPGLAGYAVYRASTATGPFTRITPATAVVRSEWEDTLAPAGTSYYRVTALNSSGAESAPSAIATAAMAKANLIANPGFETDANGDGRPDSWTSSTRFTRQAASARSERLRWSAPGDQQRRVHDRADPHRVDRGHRMTSPGG